jgi:hypothetical protein
VKDAKGSPMQQEAIILIEEKEMKIDIKEQSANDNE